MNGNEESEFSNREALEKGLMAGESTTAQRVSRKRWLTKSRFTLGVECPTKLYYTGKSDYANQKLDDEFLEALAEGGMHVGKLAQVCYPAGHEIETLEHERALAETAELLEQDEVTIFEAALAHQGLFVRVDVLVKNGSHIDLIEVKAKSWSKGTGRFFTARGKPQIVSQWRPYVRDVAFQTHVAEHALPEATITPSLLLVEKSVTCSEDGLNQRFALVEKDGRKNVELRGDVTPELARTLLTKVDVTEEVRFVRSEPLPDGPLQGRSFKEAITDLRDHYREDHRPEHSLENAPCRNCEFRAMATQQKKGQRDGRWECWGAAFGWNESDLREPSVFDLSGQVSKPSRPELIRSGHVKLAMIDPDLFHGPVDLGKTALEKPKVRQRLQIDAARTGDARPIFLKDRFRGIAEQWEWPLNFIDFETCTPAIPLHKGMRPYETVAFQFSHHILHQDGRVEHHAEWLNPDPSNYPHFEFLRRLRDSLGKSGTIFRWAPHENTVLNHIADQIDRDARGEPDAPELIQWIREHTQRGDRKSRIIGEKNMVDQRQLALELTFDPAIHGLTGIKKVLLSTIEHSRFLRDLYGSPGYGTDKFPSRNFEKFQWIHSTDKGIMDPYDLLPPITLGPDGPDIGHLDEEFELADQVKNGGAAMSAYLEIAAPDTTETRRAELRAALLKYCELDTLAMVMIMQDWLSRTSGAES